MEQPKVSVIIPVYNTEKYLRDCLDSVVNQTLKDIEIICVDDGSTDGSLEILREYERKDNRIRVLTEPKTDAGTARNNGLEYASGEFLSFLDSDDFFELTMLEHMFACAVNRNADIVICKANRLYEDSGKTACLKHIKKNLLPGKVVFSFWDIKRNAFRCVVSFVWDKLIRKDLVNKYNLRFQSQPLYNDAVFVYKAMMSAESITVLDEYLVYSRKRSANDSITDTRYQYIDCAYMVLNELKDYLMKTKQYESLKRDFACYAIELLKHTYPVKENDHVKKDEIRKKILIWLIEFDLVGHNSDYYYEPTSYWKLLKKAGIKIVFPDSERLQQERDYLKYRIGRFITWLPRGFRSVYNCFNKRGLRYMSHWIGKKLK